MTGKKTKSPEQVKLEKDVRKEIHRIKEFVRRAEKRGYVFPSDVVPPLPKVITEATLRKYQRLTPQTLYKKAVYITPENKEIKGSERRKQERSQAAKKAAQTRRENYYKRNTEKTPAVTGNAVQKADVIMGNVLQLVKQMINTWNPSPLWSDELSRLKTKDKNTLENALNTIINNDGYETVAARCEKYAMEIMIIVERVLYDSGSKYHDRGIDGIQQEIAHFIEILQGGAMTVAQSKTYTQLAEENEIRNE